MATRSIQTRRLFSISLTSTSECRTASALRRTIPNSSASLRRVTSFSLSPRYLQILLQEGYKPRETHSLKSLKTIFSAGSPLKAELYEFIRNDIKDVFINNGSGGTDVCAAFIGANPILPIYAGVIQCPMLGIKLECFDDAGKPVKEGEEGDLVISAPFPNLPLAFLGDDEKGTKLKSTYFTHYPDQTVWYQADYSELR